MADLIQFPFVRNQYSGIDNPAYISDTEAANQEILSGLTAIAGLGPTDFAILSGFTYTAGSPGNYTSGVFYLNGVWYYQPSTFTENNFLKPNVTGIMPYTFSDAVTRNLYNVNYSQTTNIGTGATPNWLGNMNTYRISNNFLKSQITTILGITGALGTAANANLGTGTGQVLTADQTYTQAQVNALLITRAPSVVGMKMTVHDFDGTFLTSFDGNGLAIAAPWYNSTTGERWGICNGIATAGGNTAPNLAGVASIGQGNDGSTIYTQGSNYGNKTHTISANDLPTLQTDVLFEGGSVAGSANMYTSGTIGRNIVSVPVNSGSPNNPVSLLQPSIADYIVIRLQ